MVSTLNIDPGDISRAVSFIHDFLESNKLSDKARSKAMLLTEETLIKLSAHADSDSKIKLTARKLFGNIYIDITSRGDDFELISDSLINNAFGLDYKGDDIPDDLEDTIRTNLIKGLSDQLTFRHNKGKSRVRITALSSKYSFLYMTLTGLILGLITGLLLRVLSDNAIELLNNAFQTVTDVFMNGLQTVVTPVVFFSIATSVAGFGKASDIGKIGGKIVLSYIVTSVLAILIGIGLFFIFKPGDPSAAGLVTSAPPVDTSTVSEMGDMSLKSFITGLIPSNIVKPFAEANMIQIIVIAVFCGLATGLIGQFSTTVKDFFLSMNELFLKITVILVRLIPIVTFCSMASMMLTIGTDSLISALSISGVTLLGFLALVIFYSVLVLVFTGMNPVHFYRKYAPTMLQVFSLSSSNAAIPLNMKACTEQLGISPKIASFSIPLGATINMNGACVQLAISALAIARIYNVSISGRLLVIMCLTIIVLSMGAPGIPGMGIILLTVILTQFNVPVEGVSLIIGIYPILDMFITVVNCLGDVVTSFIVAKSEKLLDREIFEAK
ncbi:MAG: dicarboxylate/amino acid:cation symporter [Lachnospiraceae bacterium]|nr:dicarboxylate/amino acid:cation symporter [Lachnospiraceae bacterium]